MFRELLNVPSLCPALDNCPPEVMAASLDVAAELGISRLDLFASHFSALADEASPPEPTMDFVVLQQRANAAILRLPALLEGAGARHWRDRIRERGLTVESLEYITAWSSGPGADNRREAEAVVALAVFLGASTIVAVNLSMEVDMARAAAGLAEVADIAAPAGVRVAVEWLPWTPIAHLRDVQGLLDKAARANLGYVIDSLHWHYQPGGPDWPLLESLPAERIHLVQLSDACPEDGPAADQEPMVRRVPGDGCIDLGRLLRVLADKGVEAGICAEVFNGPRLEALGTKGLAAELTHAIRSLLPR